MKKYNEYLEFCRREAADIDEGLELVKSDIAFEYEHCHDFDLELALEVEENDAREEKYVLACRMEERGATWEDIEDITGICL